jgi:hypothetical protein
MIVFRCLGVPSGVRVRRDQRWTLGQIKTLIGRLLHVGYTVEGSGSCCHQLALVVRHRQVEADGEPLPRNRVRPCNRRLKRRGIYTPTC